MKLKHKALTGLKVIDASTGTVEAVFSTLNVIDHDGDVTLPGAFTEGAEVRISAYNHASWGPGVLPVGKGTIHEVGNEAILRGQFFMNTAAGRDTFETVKELGPLGEWSYGFDIAEAEQGTQDGKAVQFLKALTVHEVSPVLLGAGINTRTLAAKSQTKQSASELSQRLQEAGTERFGADRTYVYADDYDPDAGWVVFCVSDPNDYRYMRVSFTRNGAGEVSLATDAVEVERTTDYRPKGKEPNGLKDQAAREIARAGRDHATTTGGITA